MKKNSSGLSIVEIIVSVAILSLFATISLYSFFALSRRSALDTSATIVKSVLTEARSKTLAGESGTRYGVYFSSSSVTTFSGTSYTANASGNVVSPLQSGVTISNVSLAGGGACSSSSCNIIFNRLTGETSLAGTSTVTLRGQDGATTSVTIFGTGIVE